ncbi:hypothetical protein QGM71_14995 [Virgibacillus sp. C22-A2]|uniref:Uncharacterized protein n=1 Tax=Virgibacillus tibetensis TaxID=3042313 RepID=A0ABU6KHK5_9BACI|nr:hypothetical protein [Virgibacillus sp. C22-A2]
MIGFHARQAPSCRLLPKIITTEAPCQDPQIGLQTYFQQSILVDQKDGRAGST